MNADVQVYARIDPGGCVSERHDGIQVIKLCISTWVLQTPQIFTSPPQQRESPYELMSGVLPQPAR